jgi:hypothetical protein
MWGYSQKKNEKDTCTNQVGSGLPGNDEESGTTDEHGWWMR